MINIDDLTLGQLKEIKNLTNESSSGNSMFIGKRVLVRTYSAGVHVGVLERKDGTNVLLSNSNRLWKWTNAFTLSEVATNGIGESSRVSCEVPFIELTQAIEIIPMTEKAYESVKSYVQ